MLWLAGTDPVSAQAPALDLGPCASPPELQLDGIGGSMTSFARLAEITGSTQSQSRLLRRWSDDLSIPVCGAVPWQKKLFTPAAVGQAHFILLPARSLALVNTGYPVDRNNGALWAGKGLSTEITGGIALEWGIFSAALNPTILYQQNADFIESPWRNLWGMDWPQRIGTGSAASLEPGQSFVRIDAYGVAGGISSENLWFGPGISNSILLSNTAPGFLHVFLGTSEPVDIYIANLELQGIWGRLSESTFFDENEANDHRLYTAVLVTLEPAGVPGLHLGGARVFQQNPELSSNPFPFFQGVFQPGDADEADQMLALYGRWVLPESGFEVFLEWARTDANADFHGLLTETEHSAAYVAGFQKVIERGEDWVRLYGELANLNPRLPAFRHSAGGYWYHHGDVPQGYTHRGQLLGASIGRGSDSQLLGVDFLSNWGSAGLYGERVRRAVDTFYRNAALRQGSPFQYDVELTLGGKATYFVGDLQADLGLAYSHRRNRDFLPPEPEEVEQGYRVDANWNLQLGLRWHPTMRRRTLFGPVAEDPR